jgi:hypothetical protein
VNEEIEHLDFPIGNPCFAYLSLHRDLPGESPSFDYNCELEVGHGSAHRDGGQMWISYSPESIEVVE